MTFRFESKNQTIEETLFGIDSLRVPQFQRPYSWEEDQCSDFWIDLVDDDSFFLGQFILNFENREKEKFVDIVDGQQRTTSILILCAAFRNILIDLGHPEVADVIQHNVMLAKKNFSGSDFKVSVSPNIIDFFKEYIQNGTSRITQITRFAEDEEKRVCKNYLYFESQILQHIENLSEKEKVSEIQRIYTFLLDTQIIVTKIYDENDAYEIFESVNNTGIELGVADLLKNYLFKKIRIDEGGTVNDVLDKWNEVLEYIPASDLTKFIRYYWLSKQESFVTEAKLFKAIKTSVTLKGSEFLDELLNNAKIFYELRNPNDADFEFTKGQMVKDALFGIKVMNITQCYVLLMSIYRNKDKINTNWQSTFELIEKFNFVYHAVSRQPANKVEKMYQAVAYEIESISNNSNLSDDERRVKLETQFKELKNRLKEILPSKELFVAGFKEISYKKKDLCRYALVRIEEKDNTNEYILNHPTITLEHILPQKPDKEWNLTKKQIRGYVHNIGNITLLGKKPNGSIQNKPIAQKVHLLKESTEIKMTRQLIEEVEDNGFIWNEETIKDRAKYLAEQAYEKVWVIS